MHSQPSGPIHGNWIWVTTAAVALVLLTVSALSYGAPACRSAAAASGRPAAGDHANSRSGAGTAAATTAPPQVRYGLALYYLPGTALGSCVLGPFPAGGLYASLPLAQYASGAACGTYLDVQGPRGRIEAEVVDLCAGCTSTTINLSEAAFARIADTRPGSARVTYHAAANPPLAGPLVIRVIPISTPGPIAMQILNHGNRLDSVAIAPEAAPGAGPAAASPAPAGSPAAWQQLQLGLNGFWVTTAAVGGGPYALRITDDRGHRITLTRLTLQPGSVIRTRVWMYHPAAGAAARLSAASRPPRAAKSPHC